ncbi:OmpA family protein [Algiphilus sp. NNCM1]|nr:OmpA family protein [Algiphilus acroporae]
MVKRVTTALLAAAGIAYATQGAAQIEDDRYYIAPSFSYSVVDGDRMTDNGLGGQIALGKSLTRNLTFELSGFYDTYDAEFSDQSGELTGVGLALNMFPVEERSDFYIRAALHYGETTDAPCTVQPGFTSCKTDYDSVVFDFGAGALIKAPFLNFINEGTAIRPEVVYRMDSHEEGSVGRGNGDAFYDAVFRIGLQIPLGSIYEEPKEPEPEARVVEADRPQCPAYPNLPSDVAVGADGCPLDDDADGVPNFEDQCPGAAAGIAVNAQGCELPLSQCRPPFPGEDTDDRGCAMGDTVVLRGVTFNFDSARITPDARVILDDVADVLLDEPGLVVEIGGHTDSKGASAYNQQLSSERADAVVDYLLDRGVAPDQLEAEGYGETQPIASNDTEDGREMNRRVELRILETRDDV